MTCNDEGGPVNVRIESSTGVSFAEGGEDSAIVDLAVGVCTFSAGTAGGPSAGMSSLNCVSASGG